MRVVSIDEASNLFRACFCHGDASFATGDASVQNALYTKKMKALKCKPSAQIAELI